ncbi:ATP-binding protein [Butyrivibrio sp. NC3005]|uniref:ATP-binding protein n=1 Tax=Butyrivibrio sp. NC3005 TaxID=1280685 RepID=UPI000411D80A|nr:SbcC/MukB-like Walker B domain-containing protein [Butyrivibrio sp. NC3005]
MIRLTRVFVYNWGKFDEPTVMSVGDITLLSGANQAGKSQIIDAAMMVLTGRKKGIFNKAADKHSARNVEKYFYGYWASNNQEKYLRYDGFFTSYVVLEFYNDIKDEYFCNGLVADCPQDHSRRVERWFSFEKKAIPENHFVFDDMALNISELKRYLKTYVGDENFHFYTDTEYSKYILHAYGQVRSEYVTLLKAAVACSIGENLNIDSFITDSICSVNETVDLTNIRSTIHDYYDLKDKAESSKRKIDKLLEIQEKYNIYHEDVEQVRILDYALIRDEQQIQKKQQDASTQLIEQLTMDVEQTKALNVSRSEKRKKLQEEIGRVHEELGKSDTEQIRRSLEEKKKDIDDKRKGYIENIERVCHIIQNRGASWQMSLITAENAGFKAEESAEKVLKNAMEIRADKLGDFDVENANEVIGNLYQSLGEYHAKISSDIAKVKDKMKTLKEKITALSGNQKQYPKETMSLKYLLEDELSKKYGTKISIPLFSELLEIRDDSWQNAIEGYLDNQRFDLMVPKEYYEDALEIYRENKDTLKSYKSGLIDIERIRENANIKAEEGSLAEEIITDNEDARLYADYKLGYIHKVEKVSELYQHKCAITKDLLIYKGFVTRGKAFNPTLFIGRRAIEMQINQANEELGKLKKKLDELSADLSVTSTDKLEQKIVDMDFFKTAVVHINDVEELEDKSLELLRQIGSVDTSRDEELHDRLKGLNARLEELSSLIGQSSLECGRAENKIESEQRKLENSRREYDELEEKAGDASRFPANWREEKGDEWIREDMAQNRRKNLKKTLEDHQNMRQEVLERQSRHFTTLKRLRTQYNMEETAGFDPDRSFDNEEYETELTRLKESGFSTFEGEIAKAAQRATNEFKVEFIGKLKANIQQAQEQIDAVNQVLESRWFGNVRYSLVHEKEKSYEKFYDMFMDPNLVKVDPDLPGYGGMSIFSGPFEEAHKEEIEELLQLILDERNLTEQQRISREKKLQLYTDYRTYLHLDLMSTDHSGSSKYMSDVIRDESGSGIQTPYYIVMFAAIAQKVRAYENANTLRVVILDEAFNKMDENKIAASIDLLKSFDLQPIFCCVPEKVKVIASKADITNIVMMYTDKSSYIEHFTNK